MKMKHIWPIFIIALGALHAEPAKVRVLQCEYIRDGGFMPNKKAFPGVTWIEPNVSLTVPKGKTPAVAPKVSDHATNVARILLGGPASGLVESITIAEAVSFQGRVSSTNPTGLNCGRTTPYAPATWEIENHSWGGMDPLWMDDSPGVDGILTREAKRIEEYNILALIAIPNPGESKSGAIYNRLLSDAVSPNIIKVASSVSGYASAGANSKPDIFAPVQYNSYATPTAAQTGVAMISWCRTNGIAYKAADLAAIIKATAVKDTQGRPMLNHEAAMKALAAKYAPQTAAPTIAPSGQPVSATVTTGQEVTLSVTAQGTPPFTYYWLRKDPAEGARGGWVEIPNTNVANYVITADVNNMGSYLALVRNAAGAVYSNEAILTVSTPPMQQPVPEPTPTPTPIPTPTPAPKPAAALAVIKRFTRNAAWAPVKFSWTTQNATAAWLIDPAGVRVPVAVNGSYTATKLSNLPGSNKLIWTLEAQNADGVPATQALPGVHAVIPPN